LDALRFLSEISAGPTGKALQDRSGFFNVLRRGASMARHLGFRIEFTTAEGAHGYYSVRINRDASFEREKFRIDQPGAEFEAKAGVLTSSDLYPVPLGHAYLAYMAGYPDIRGAADLIRHIRVYRFDPRTFRQPESAGFTLPLLNNDGSNLADVIHHLSPDVLERIVQYLSVVTPGIKSVQTVEVGGYRALEFRLESDRSPFPPTSISDGTVHSLAVLAALFHVSAGLDVVSLVGLEEPEAALHPAAAGVIFDALREASTSIQVIATTHSADLLDKKEIDADCILSVDMEGGATRIGHVDDTGKKALTARLYTAGELMRMNYLKPESAAAPTEFEMESILFGDLVPA